MPTPFSTRMSPSSRPRGAKSPPLVLLGTLGFAVLVLVLVLVLAAVLVAEFTPSAPGGVEREIREVSWLTASFGGESHWAIRFGMYVLYGIVFLVCVYTVRHYLFTYNRMFGRQRHPYLPIDAADWPRITILIPCHNEEKVVHHILDALLEVDYPRDRMRVIPVNDRSQDRTRDILDAYCKRHPDFFIPLHRTEGMPGKAAALKEAIEGLEDDIILVFDADYIPGHDLIKPLVAPFLDPEIGAVMGRVVPLNTPKNLLTRMLDMERSAGYQVDQQARMNLGVIAQYGGTVGGVRVSALRQVGGWRENSLTEDTDITFRLVLGGWKIAYSNRYECYEEVPETWPVRIRQIMRWARGHTDAAMLYLPDLWRTPGLRFRERLDGSLLLGTYLMSPLLLSGWVLALFLFFLGANPLAGVVAILAVASYGTIGNFAAFFEIAAAVRLDGNRSRINLLPLILGGFIVSMVSTSRAVVRQILFSREPLQWDKTVRYRRSSAGSSIPAPDRSAVAHVATGTRISGAAFGRTVESDGTTGMTTKDASVWRDGAHFQAEDRPS